MRVALWLVLVFQPAMLSAQTELRARVVYEHDGATSGVSVRARNDGRVEIRSYVSTIREACTLESGEAATAGAMIRTFFASPPVVPAGEEVTRTTARFGLLCPVRLQLFATRTTAEYRLLHDTGGGIEIRPTVPGYAVIASALVEAAATTDSITQQRSPAEGGALRLALSDEAYFDFQVDKPATAARDSEGPRYPDILRSGGIEGEVLGQFVVDTLGRVDIASFRVLRSTHPLFEQSVRAALPGLRFLPAELRGKKVRQLVQQPFTFELRR